jgi:hypothetical protein
MSKLLNLFMVLLLLVTSCAFAQSIFDQPSSPAGTATTPTGSSSLNASDFKSAVNKMAQQTNNELGQQAKQLLPKPSTNNTNQNPTTSPPANLPEATPSSVDNSFSVNNGNSPTAQPGASAAAPVAAPSQPQQPSNNYTGFGGSKNTTKSNTPASSGNSGGWNINY